MLCQWIATFVGAVCMACVLGDFAQAEDVAEAGRGTYTVHKTATPVTINGRLDEPAWKSAETITHFSLFSRVNVSRLPNTITRLLWNHDYLYAAFDSQDDDIWSYSKTNDDPLYMGDVVELFVKPRQDNLAYYEFVFAPNGAIYDARYSSRGAGLTPRFATWNSQAKVATSLDGTDADDADDDKGYVVEIAIPWKSFRDGEQPGDPSEWTFGAFRYDYSKSYDDPLMLMSIPCASKQHGFHEYEQYRPLRFEK